MVLKFAKEILASHDVSLFNIAELPYFDPDQQFSDLIPSKVRELRESAFASDLILISTPEYAHGIPGILKNALEWLFCEGTIKKPASVIIRSSQGEHVRSQLIEVLGTMDFLIDENRIIIINSGRSFLEEEIKGQIKSFLEKQIKPAHEIS